MKRSKNLTDMRRLKVEEQESVKYFVAVGWWCFFSMCWERGRETEGQ